MRQNAPVLLSIEECNERSRISTDASSENVLFFFDYSKEGTGKECLDWRQLRKLKDRKRWGIVRHPFVLNFINHKLVECAFIYTFHIFAFFSFLLLLSWHIFARTFYKDALVTIFVAVFIFFLILKATIKARVSQSWSIWFLLSFVFNLSTYSATLAYVWLPTLFSYDDYHQEVKNIVTWFLPIVAIISAWANFLFILRKSPFGVYIFMMTRILRSFGHIATIWIPTLIAFSFAFHLIMKDSGVEPWSAELKSNATTLYKLLVVLQAVTKTSTMMIGEVDANDMLATNQWIPSILILAFEIITVILLMNLMVSLAVGDVNDLRHSAQDKLLKIKLDFVVEALQLSEQFGFSLHTKPTNNFLAICKDDDYITKHDKFPEENGISEQETLRIANVESGIRIRIKRLDGRSRSAQLKNCMIECVETADSNIPVITYIPSKYNADEISVWDKFCRWIIGLDWAGYLDI